MINRGTFFPTRSIPRHSLMKMPYDDCCGPFNPQDEWKAGCQTHKGEGGCAAYDCEFNGNCGGVDEITLEKLKGGGG